MIAALLLILVTSISCAEPLSENQARFGAITGDVGLLSQGAVDWIVPHEGLPIDPGDHIRTGEDGRVELALSDSALWTLEPQTDVVMEHMDTRTGRLDLSSGTLMGIVDSNRSVGMVQRWEFNTPTAVAVVRGTEFAIEVTRHESARLGVFEGLVDLEPAETASGLQPPVQVPGGHEALAKRIQPVQISGKFSPRLKALSTQRRQWESRLKVIEDTWSPFTPTVRAELRRKFVAVPPKPKIIRRPPPRARSGTSKPTQP